MSSPSFERIRLSVDGGVATITLAHHPLNIYDLQMRDELIEAFAAVRIHPDARVLVLAADGRHFSAGADLKEFGTARDVLDARSIRWRRDPWTPLAELPHPTIAALHGYALGAGCEMALLCDIRVAAADTTIGLPETKLGMLPSAGGSQSLARVAGTEAAVPLVMLGHSLDAERAHRLRIVDLLADDADATARQLANEIAGLPQHAAQACRRALRAARDTALPVGLRLERTQAIRALAD